MYSSRGKWLRYGLAATAFVALVFLAMHPELRLLVPTLDAVGLDVVMLLMATQVLSGGRALVRLCVLPAVRGAYRGVLYFLGIAGPGVDALVRRHVIPRLAPHVAVQHG